MLLPTLQASPAVPSATPAVASTRSPIQVIDGTYVEVHADARIGDSAAPEGAPEDWLRTTLGKLYRLQSYAHPKLDAENSVRVTGAVSGNEVAVTSAVPTTQAYSTAGTTRTGTRSVLIMMVNWTRPDAVTPAAATKQVGVTVNNWYRTVSHGRLGFSATATPWMTLPKQDCGLETAGYWKVLAAAEKQAIAHGFTPSAYKHEMVYFPYDAKCNYGGLGSVNDRDSWVNGEMDSRVTVHELGHNIGLNHARSAVCVDQANHQATESVKCTTNEYGDLFDAMGVPAFGTPQFGALQMNHLGWLTGHLATPTTSRSITLSPLENGIGTLAARIRVGGTEYWLEYRRPVGVDASLVWTPGAIDGILIHRVGPDGGSDLLDARPDSTKSFANAALPVGRTWTARQGLSVKVTSASSTRAVVSLVISPK